MKNCQKFQKEFTTNGNLKIHIQNVHEKLKLYQCIICDSKFGQKFGLKNHIKNAHEEIKAHTCNLCNKSFGDSRNLKKHIKNVHEGERKFKCETCLILSKDSPDILCMCMKIKEVINATIVLNLLLHQKV